MHAWLSVARAVVGRPSPACSMSEKPDEAYLYHEEVEISDDSGEDAKYGAVSDGDSSSDEDISTMLSAIKSGGAGASVGAPSPTAGGVMRQSGGAAAAAASAAAASAPGVASEAVVEKKHTVIDDFIRNFLSKLGMERTLDSFETEWYQMKQQGRIREEDAGQVPDIYAKNEAMNEQVKTLRKELEAMRLIANKAKATWDKFKKQRDYHRMHHRRVVQEKDKLVGDIKRLKKQITQFEPALAMMRKKYESAINSSMMMRIQKERAEAKIAGLLQQMRGQEEGAQPGAADAARKRRAERKGKTLRRRGADSVIPPDSRPNPNLNKSFEPVSVQSFKLAKTFKGHKQSIGGISLHPKKPVLATVSDDRTWKLWSIPKGELIMSGAGHKSWIGGCEFHPRGNLLATTSGDGTVKVWDFVRTRCAVTFTDHTQAVWDCSFHDTGDFLATCSMDQTVRVWDLNSERCRTSFRGHVDSVNSVCFQPYSNNVCTGSADKSVSLWDLRTGLCIQTFVGHSNAVASVSFNIKGDSIATTDADGQLKIWDVRMVTERLGVDVKVPINDAKFDKSSRVVSLACDDGTIKVIDSGDGKVMGVLSGHEAAVQALEFDPAGRFLVSCGSDNSFRVWT